ncbi:MAG: copper chaperone PCu(A)C [Granulosicoccus sp.]
MKILATATLLFGLSLFTSAQAELPQISDARVVQPPPGANVAAAYFTINNSGTEALEITSAQSDIAKKVEVHLSFIENDVAKMEKQESVIVGAGESVEFKHGSFHVMFMGLNEELLAGNSLDLVLNTSAGDISVSVPVISLDEAMSGQPMKEEISADNMKKGMTDPMHSGHGKDK